VIVVFFNDLWSPSPHFLFEYGFFPLEFFSGAGVMFLRSVPTRSSAFPVSLHAFTQIIAPPSNISAFFAFVVADLSEMEGLPNEVSQLSPRFHVFGLSLPPGPCHPKLFFDFFGPPLSPLGDGLGGLRPLQGFGLYFYFPFGGVGA